MKLNDIKFLPATNAVADVYAKATGMPFVGEMMVAAAGQESEPTPDPEPTPTEFTVSNVRAVEYDYDVWTIQADANMDATGYTVYVQGDNGAFVYYLKPDEEDHTKLVECIDCEDMTIDPEMLSDGGGYTGWYREEGAVEEQTIQGTYTVVPMQRGPIEISNLSFWKEDENWKCGAEANHNAVGYDIIVEGSASEFNVKLVVNEEGGDLVEDQDPTQLIMDENYENYIGDICEGGNWTAHTSYNGTDFQDQSGTYETPDGCPADCENEWEDREYSSYWDCECNENDHCVDCENDWEAEGFESYWDCDCQVNGNNCPEEPAPFEITDISVMLGNGGYDTIAYTTNDSTDYSINVTIMDATGELIWFTSDMEIDGQPNEFYGSDNGDIDPNATVPSLGEDVGNYTAIISDGNGGEWTVTGTYDYWDE